MSRRLRALPFLAATTIAVAGLAACGSNGSSGNSASSASSDRPAQNNAPGETIATVGVVPITRAQVNHWMTALAGTTYNNVSHGLTLPEGLVSDPPNYARCVAALETAATGSPLGHPRETGVELLAKCRELNQALKLEATSYLITTQRTIDIAREEGITATNSQVQQLFKQVKAREYPTENDLHQYLASKRLTLPDLLLEIKLDLLGEGLLKTLRAHNALPRYNNLGRQWTTKTSCNTGYIVENCKQYKNPQPHPTTTPPSALLEQVSALATGQCPNLAGCAKQIGQ